MNGHEGEVNFTTKHLLSTHCLNGSVNWPGCGARDGGMKNVDSTASVLKVHRTVGIFNLGSRGELLEF
jgi:hypothetical protein